MNVKEALAELEKAGTAQNRKIYARHGVKGEMYGVSYANLGALKKKIKTDHALTLGLWASGNHDARILALLIADPEQISSKELDAWARELDNYGITEAFSRFAAQTPHARAKIKKWTPAKGEWVGEAGWSILGALALHNPNLPDDYFEPYLDIIEQDIHHRKNRTRYAMNNALIAIGTRTATLQKRALAVARAIGQVEVDHGQTNCKTPDALTYIPKAFAHRQRKPAPQNSSWVDHQTRKHGRHSLLCSRRGRRAGVLYTTTWL
ncbi:MAG: DNA alkylation repair protein [Anaerolineales bacterium]